MESELRMMDHIFDGYLVHVEEELAMMEHMRPMSTMACQWSASRCMESELRIVERARLRAFNIAHALGPN